MKQPLIILAATIFIIASCSENKNNQENTNVTKDTAVNIKSERFSYGDNGDSILLTLQNSNTEITGALDFLPYEKDCRIGTIKAGKMSGDTLYAIYNSTQEGQDLESEIALLKIGNDYKLSEEIYGSRNFKYNNDYTKGNIIDKSKIIFDGVVLKKVSK